MGTLIGFPCFLVWRSRPARHATSYPTHPSKENCRDITAIAGVCCAPLSPVLPPSAGCIHISEGRARRKDPGQGRRLAGVYRRSEAFLAGCTAKAFRQTPTTPPEPKPSFPWVVAGRRRSNRAPATVRNRTRGRSTPCGFAAGLLPTSSALEYVNRLPHGPRSRATSKSGPGSRAMDGKRMR